jgi:uncharacterized protein YpmB
MTTITSNSQKNQLSIFLVVVMASSLFLITSLVNPIGQISQQQYVFAQKNTALSTDNKTSTNNTLFLISIIILHGLLPQSTHGL